MTVIGNTAKRGLPAAPVSPVPPAPPGSIALTRPTPVRGRRSPVRVPRLARRVVGPLLVLLLWYLVCATKLFSSVEVASPLAVLDAARELWSQGVLQSNLVISLQRVVEGLTLGVAAGAGLAVLSGLFWVGEDLLDPVIQAMRSVPILGLVPLVIIWFGVGQTPKVFLIASAASSLCTSTHTRRSAAWTSSWWRPARRSG